jgi:hypothetical protein
MMKNPTPFSYYLVIEACGLPDCPLCRLSEKWVNGYLDALMYEDVNDTGTREVLHQSLGFCNEHAWRLPDTGGGAPLGIAIIYHDLLGRMMRELQEARFQRPNTFSLRQAQEMLDPDKPAFASEDAVRRLQPETECPACAHRARMEAIALSAMLDALADGPQMQAALKASAGLCLPHLRRAFELTHDETAFTLLTALAQEKLASLRAELAEFIRKCDYRFRDEAMGAEGDSWSRAIAQMVGQAGVR